MTKSKNLVFFGTEDFSLHSLRQLFNDGWDIEMVITKPDSRKGRGLVVVPPVVKQFAVENGIKVCQPEDTKELKKCLKNKKSTTAVLSAYGKIIPEDVIALFKKGIINIHPSLLPKYRGASPIESVILNGDKQTGVSLMQLVKAMDAGPVYKQVSLRLIGNETSEDLYERLGEMGAKLLTENLDKIIRGKLKGKPQDDAMVTIASKIHKKDSLIDPSLMTAQEIDRRVRAFKKWPGAKINLGDKRVKIVSGHTTASNSETKLKGKITADETTGLIKVETHKGYYYIERLKSEGKREMTSKEFLAGNKII